MKTILTVLLTATALITLTTAASATEKMTTSRTNTETVYTTTTTKQDPSSENTTNRAFGRHYNSFSNEYRQPEALASASVIDLQIALAAQGYYKGDIDGLWGTETTDAVRAYQEAHGWPVTGMLSTRDMQKVVITTTETTYVNDRR